MDKTETFLSFNNLSTTWFLWCIWRGIKEVKFKMYELLHISTVGQRARLESLLGWFWRLGLMFDTPIWKSVIYLTQFSGLETKYCASVHLILLSASVSMYWSIFPLLLAFYSPKVGMVGTVFFCHLCINKTFLSCLKITFWLLHSYEKLCHFTLLAFHLHSLLFLFQFKPYQLTVGWPSVCALL